jgi:hypothetical protein
MLKISIPTPCHQDWGAMSPNEQGRHCTSCAKTVVDFTGMTDDEVKYFFINKKEEKVCGRFKNEQLQRIMIELPHNIFYIPMPGWKKFLVASLLVFSSTLFSCDTAIKGEITEDTSGKLQLKNTLLPNDTASVLALPLPPTTPPTCTTTLGYTVQKVVTGAIQVLPPIEPTITGDTVIQYNNTTTGTPTVINVPEKMGEIEMIKPDTLKTKNLPKVDSINSNTQTFY